MSRAFIILACRLELEYTFYPWARIWVTPSGANGQQANY